MLAVQTCASFALSAAPVLAPAVAPGLGIAPARVGLFIGTAYLLAMLSGLRTGHWSARLGPARVSQLLLPVLAAGMAGALIGHPVALLLAAVVIGGAYGAANPAAAAVLGRHAPASGSGLFFALKQAGVPLGVALAGGVLPWLLLTAGWQLALAGPAAAAVLLALLLQPAVRRLDAGVTAAAPAGALASLRATLQDRALRRLSLMSLTYAMLQQAFITFVVALLHLERGLPLPVAAGLLAASQLLCTVMRIAMGHVADCWIAPRVLLGLLGCGSAASFVALGLLPASAGVTVQALAVLACSATAMGWNGVYFAELARLVPGERMAIVAGGTQCFTFAGAMLGPVLFGALAQATGSHAQGYLVFALGGLAAGWMMLRAADPPVPAERPGPAAC